MKATGRKHSRCVGKFLRIPSTTSSACHEDENPIEGKAWVVCKLQLQEVIIIIVAAAVFLCRMELQSHSLASVRPHSAAIYYERHSGHSSRLLWIWLHVPLFFSLFNPFSHDHAVFPPQKCNIYPTSARALFS